MKFRFISRDHEISKEFVIDNSASLRAVIHKLNLEFDQNLPEISCHLVLQDETIVLLGRVNTAFNTDVAAIWTMAVNIQEAVDMVVMGGGSGIKFSSSCQ